MAKLTILKNPAAADVNNSTGRKRFCISIAEVVRRPPFSTLYPIAEATVDLIVKDMQENRYDDANPVKVWRREASEGQKELSLVDGNTRVTPAQKLGMTEITAGYLMFDDENEVLLYPGAARGLLENWGRFSR